MTGLRPAPSHHPPAILFTPIIKSNLSSPICQVFFKIKVVKCKLIWANFFGRTFSNRPQDCFHLIHKKIFYSIQIGMNYPKFYKLYKLYFSVLIPNEIYTQVELFETFSSIFPNRSPSRFTFNKKIQNEYHHFQIVTKLIARIQNPNGMPHPQVIIPKPNFISQQWHIW